MKTQQYRPFLCLCFLCLIIAACGLPQTAAPSFTPYPELITPTPTYPATSTVMPSVTATKRLTFTREPTYTITATRTATPTLAPLSQTGPWLLLSESSTYSGQWSFIDPVISNEDGSAWESANLPRVSTNQDEQPVWWLGNFSPNSSYIAVQDIISEYQPQCVQALKDSLYAWERQSLSILKLPENMVVQQFQLLGREAAEQIREDECKIIDQNRHDTPPVLGVVGNGNSFHWSPDGRYLAFPAAPTGTAADLYLYDTQTDTIRRLTTRQNNPNILGWSPDSQTILYQGVTQMDLFRIQILESSGLYAVSVSGADRLLLESGRSHHGLEWLSANQLLLTDGYCNLRVSEECTINLRLYDLATGGQEVIFGNLNTRVHYAVDPLHHLLIISNPPEDLFGAVHTTATPTSSAVDVPGLEGVYLYDFSTRTLQPVVEEEVGQLSWDNDRQVLRGNNHDMQPPYDTHSTLFHYEPGSGFRIEKIDNLPDLSPDGQWGVVDRGEDRFITDRQGNVVQPLIKQKSLMRRGCGWSPDSSAYIEMILLDQRNGEIWMMVYSLENNWQPVRAQTITTRPYLECWWIAP